MLCFTTGDGGCGADVLEKMVNSLLEEKPDITSPGSREVNANDFDLEKLLEQYGPGLVTGFDCNKHFKMKKKKKCGQDWIPSIPRGKALFAREIC
jgi:hypothetical protein